ncbi:MAG: type II toxin-antitoxin system VapC family toxin [Myxococcota bacterium]
MSLVLDSCILIDYLAGNASAREYIRSADGAAISMITWMEVVVGAASPDEELVVRAFLATFEILPVDASVAEEAVRLRRARRMKPPDAIIFATARVHRRELATRNTKDFATDEPGVRIPYRLP